MPQAYYDFLVGTFDTPELYTLRFTPPSSHSEDSSGTLHVLHHTSAFGSHSWLHLSPIKKDGSRNLYATAWTEPPAVVAYAVKSPTDIQLLGSARTRSRSGYVTASQVALYSAGGDTGEVFSLDPKTGNIVSPIKTEDAEEAGVGGKDSTEVEPLQFLEFAGPKGGHKGGDVMDFGGLRHGAHSADLSPDGRALYVADIGRNCIWTFSVDRETGRLTLGEKHKSPRSWDGPRHVWPHPSGKFVYCLQEHSSMVDVFSTSNHGVNLQHVGAARIIPVEDHSRPFWADEVRTSLSSGENPKYLYASTRGLKEEQKGFVAVYKLTDAGEINNAIIPHRSVRQRPVDSHEMRSNPHWTEYQGLLYLWPTPTSGGWANAIQPGPTVDGVEYLAMTDSEQGFVFVLGWDGVEMKEVARTKLDSGAGAATAVWL